MTISDLAKQGISKIWHPPWVNTSYLELTLIPGKDDQLYYGPWGYIHDIAIEKAASEGEDWAKDIVDACKRPVLLLMEFEKDSSWLPWPPDTRDIK